MKKIYFLFLSCAVATLPAFAQVKMPAPSPTQYVKQDFGLSSIELTYSRPGVKGRVVFGNIVPYDSLWRTGANAATKITFNDPVEILGHQIPAGSYAIYTIPHKNGEWTFILNNGFKNSGVTGYKQTDDLLRERIKTNKLPSKVETFTIQFNNIANDNCVLSLMWDKVAMNVPIKQNIKIK